MPDAPELTEHSPYQELLDEISRYTDLPMRITIQMGKLNMPVREILQLKENSVVEIPKSAGENIDIYVNGTLLAYGEVLDLEGSAGIRITDLLINQ